MEILIGRIEGLALLARNMKKLDPYTFGTEPVAGFIDALAKDIDEIVSDYLASED
jgi:hypothetical protein